MESAPRNAGDRREPAVSGHPVIDPADWRGDELAQRSDWIFQLTDKDVDSLVGMSERIRRQIHDDPNKLLELRAGDFDLGGAEEVVRSVRQTLKDGLGLALIRGLPVGAMDRLNALTIYWAIGRRLGEARSNNADGDMIGHVTDLGKDYRDSNTRGYQTRAEMDYHCDQTDLVGLMCVRTARSGGVSKVASSVAVYNELVRRHPELLTVLTQPFCWSKHGETDPDDKGFYESPVFNFLDGYLCTSFGPKHIEKGHALPAAPDMTPEQRKAIATTESIADELHLSMELQVGDMQFLNNSVALHTRTEYEDWEEPERKRLLWRLWLMAPDIRPHTPYIQEWSKGVQTMRTKERIVI